MGMWSSPFSDKKNALKLKELMSKPWKMELINNSKELPDAYDIIGSDDLFDILDEYSAGDDVRHVIKGYLQKWLEEIDSFRKIDNEAVEIVKQIIEDLES